MENITHAKRQLFESLKARYEGIMGTGIKEKDGHEYIVVYISAQDKIQYVPAHYMGNKVIAEVKGSIKAL
ncbi:MAG: hypothetical protein INR73_24070 [Williamsia sp.]|nr:hypothetical protein [Williamsia sp.]